MDAIISMLLTRLNFAVMFFTGPPAGSEWPLIAWRYYKWLLSCKSLPGMFLKYCKKVQRAGKKGILSLPLKDIK